MNKGMRKFLISGVLGVLTFVLFAFGFIMQKAQLWSTYWWRGPKISGYDLVGGIDNFGGFLTTATSIMILVGAGLLILVSIFGMLNAAGKTKIRFGKISLDKLTKWILFITVCLNLLNVFWVLINCGSLNKMLGDTKTLKYVITFAPFFNFIAYGIAYCYYCLADGSFIWMKKFWEKKQKQSNIVETPVPDATEVQNLKQEQSTEEPKTKEKHKK